MRVIDVRHLGRERVIGAWMVDGALVDPGPESTVTELLAGLAGEQPRAILLTHIHFDHAGASGALVRRWPDVPVYVHERGARHLESPDRLVASATRLYGEDGMTELWGEVVPVPAANLRPLAGGETVLGSFRVAYTPGHASHHVCYFHEPTGAALVGDVAGVRVPPSDVVVAPTPPPDIDVDAWERSLDVVEAWRPSMLGLTHFGAVTDVPEHLAELRRALRRQEELARRTELGEFTREIRRALAERTDEATADAFLQAAPAEHLYAGLRRWLSAGDGAAGPPPGRG